MARFDDDVSVVLLSVRQQSNHLIVHYHSYPYVLLAAVVVAAAAADHCDRQIAEEFLAQTLYRRHHQLGEFLSCAQSESF